MTADRFQHDLSPSGDAGDAATPIELRWGAFDVGDRPELTTPADLLRRAADGELTDVEQAALDAHLAEHPADRARVETDRAVGERAARALGGVTAPAGLRERVLAAAQANQIQANQIQADHDEVADRVERLSERTRERSFWRGAGGVIAMAAAVALLLTTIVLVRPASAERDPFASAVSFVGEEHVHCVSDLNHATRKFIVADAASAPEAAQRIIGQPVDLAQITRLVGSGFTYEGAGACGVPGGPSFHMSFVGNDDSQWSGQRVSVFVQVAPSESKVRTDLAEGVTYKAVSGVPRGEPVQNVAEGTPAATESDHKCEGAASIFFWRSGPAVYYLVTDATVCDKPAREAFEAPETTESLELLL
ncbi:MAG: hypothetical protein AAGK04_08695 [Planctomycetota bacterium]